MIDPIHSLAFSMHANRGVYAVLFGSGLSRSAKIPTGWEITLDLVRRLAAVSEEDCGENPEKWYREKYAKEPDYSELLDALAKTPAERQQLLRPYWEPDEQEREEGAKRPTNAHRAIASLVAKGFIRVIVTTNFDRLMEMALAEVGVTPTLLSSPDQVHGALPLIHTQCCLFKVHGDYLDTRILNTPAELSSYPVEYDRLLDRIIDEFGLVVCGWSADWDEALRRALMRASSRRFATYWAVRGEPSDAARALIQHRAAQVIPIVDADSFLATLQRQVESLEDFSRPHPLSTAAAVASLKRYMSDSRYRIQHADLVSEEVRRVLASISHERFPTQGGETPTAEIFNRRVKSFEAAMETLTPMAVEAGRWAEKEHQDVWLNALSHLTASRAVNGGYTVWLELERYPATLFLYALGVMTVYAKKLEFLHDLITISVAREHHENKFVVDLLPAACLFENDGVPKWLSGMEARRVPVSDWLCVWLKPFLKNAFPTEKAYELCFDKFEILLALAYGYRSGRPPEWYWVPPGAFAYRNDNRTKILSEMKASLTPDGSESLYVTSKLFGITAEECLKSINDLEAFISRLRWY
jgi:hypothetical protein